MVHKMDWGEAAPVPCFWPWLKLDIGRQGFFSGDGLTTKVEAALLSGDLFIFYAG